MLKEFEDKNWETEIKEETVTICQMSAHWCSPCQSLKVVMEKLSDEYKDRANFYYGDVEEGAINTASASGIRGVPSTIVGKKVLKLTDLLEILEKRKFENF